MTTTLEDKDGTVTIKKLHDGRSLISAAPKPGGIYILENRWETSYPLDLIKVVFEVNGSAGLCDTIMRDEDPNYVQKFLGNDLLAYFTPEDFVGKNLLDFGCGNGASSMILARMFPDTDITGVELVESSLRVARKRLEYFNVENVRFYQSPNGSELPDEVGQYDFVIMSAVFEHLLPPERKIIMPKLWSAVRPGGHLFINQTPNRLFPFELHTTMLPLINYVPDGLALKMARRYSKRVEPDESWEQLLRKGIRGATEKEIMRLLPPADGVPIMLEPQNQGLRDRIDLYYKNTNPDRHQTLKKVARVGIKAIQKVTGYTIVPDLSIAFQKQT